MQRISTDSFLHIKSKANTPHWSKEIYHRFCRYSNDDTSNTCEKESPLDLTILIDTSGKQVTRLGDKKKIIIEFIQNLFGKFENKELLKLSIVLFGDYRSGEVMDVISPAEQLTKDSLLMKLRSFKWYVVMSVTKFIFSPYIAL